MTADGGIRASDRDRESAAEVLREAYAAGRLDLEEFDERASAAYAARTWGELRALTADLPAGPDLGADLPVRVHQPLEQGQADPGARYGPKRPFIPMLPMALVWLAIAAVARAPEAVLPLVILSLFALRAAGWRRTPPDPPAQQGGFPRRPDDAV
ncbi:MAG TPA: DUF1707 domain-containing protein [Streptosporangiaceae bacterium]|nr:DUF1707 domain-containing protein [Streptosporangiaceae bacterium]